MAPRSTPSEPTSTDHHGESRRRRWWPVLTPLAVLAIGLSLVSPAGRHQWALSLFRQPTHDTVLFFDKAWALPATAPVRAPLTVSFTIGNNEGRAEKYRYILSISGGSHTRILEESARVVDAGQSWTVSTMIRPACGDTSRCRVEVSLAGHPETIDFLVTSQAKKSGAGGKT
jgi:hypothetical protein